MLKQGCRGLSEISLTGSLALDIVNKHFGSSPPGKDQHVLFKLTFCVSNKTSNSTLIRLE